jgi:hypothetical protein
MRLDAESPRWIGWAALGSALALLVLLGCTRIWSVDYWWLLATGDWIARHGVPTHDVFSYTNPGSERLELRWLFCLGLYALVGALGHGAATVVKIAVVSTAFALIVWAGFVGARRKSLSVAAVTVVIAAMACNQRLVVRPETVSFLLAALFVALIARRIAGPTRLVWLLPFAEVVWVNVHGLFPLGLAYVGAWLAGEMIELAIEIARARDRDPDRIARVRTAAGVLAGTGVAWIINPYFLRAALLPLVLWRGIHGAPMQSFVAELKSPLAYGLEFEGLYYYYALIAACGIALALNWSRQRAFWAILLASQLYLSLVAIRNIPLFAIAAVPFVIANAGSTVEEWLRVRARAERLAPCAALVFCAGMLVWQGWRIVTERFWIDQGDTNQFGVGLAEHRFPIRATEFLRGASVAGPLFNSVRSGSYLLWAGFPVYIDPRMDLYETGILGEYRDAIASPERMRQVVEARDIRVLFLDADQTPLIQALARDRNWRCVYADEVAVLFFAVGAAPDIPAIVADAQWLARTRDSLGSAAPYASLGPLDRVANPLPFVWLARIALILRGDAAARELFEEAERAWPDALGANDWIRLSIARRGSGDVAGGADAAARAAQLAPEDVEVQRFAAAEAARAAAAGAK